MLSLEACFSRHIEVAKLVYNLYPPTSKEITDDTRRYLKQYLQRHSPSTEFIEIPLLEKKWLLPTADLAQIQTLGYK